MSDSPGKSRAADSAGFTPPRLFGLLVLLLTSASSLLPGCSDSTGPETGFIYFPLSVGAQWTYAPENPQFGDPFMWEVTARSGDTVTLNRPNGGSHPGPVTLLDGLSTVKISLGGDEFATLHRFTPGASWTRRDPWECDDGSKWVAVRETEPVETPARTYTNTLRLERRTEANCTDAGTMIEWWAPGVGLVRWEELNFYAGGPLTFNLTSHLAPLS